MTSKRVAPKVERKPKRQITPRLYILLTFKHKNDRSDRINLLYLLPKKYDWNEWVRSKIAKVNKDTGMTLLTARAFCLSE